VAWIAPEDIPVEPDDGAGHPSAANATPHGDGGKDHRARQTSPMRTTIEVDEALLAEAQRLTGQSSQTVLIREGLKALIERESARRLARLGASEPTAPPGRRGRAKAAPVQE
jgi:Arc/MetJ family transcription regulator